MSDTFFERSHSSAATATTDLQWFVLHTRSRQEKVVASDLEAMGVSHYLPLVRQARYYGTRKRYVDLPLFPGYLFLHGLPEHAYQLDRARRLTQIIKVVDETRFEWEVNNIRLALEKSADLMPHDYLQEGVRVEVRAGPFRGLQGIVEQRKKQDRLVLQVHSFGGAVSLEIDGALLVRID